MGRRMGRILALGLGALVMVAGIFLLVTADHDGRYDDPQTLGGSADSYSATMFVGRQVNDSWSGSVGRLSGVHGLFTRSENEAVSVTLTCSLAVTGGRAKLIWADPEGNVTTLLEKTAGETGEETVTLTLPAGVNRFKVAGADKAACAWTVKVEE